MKKFWMISLFTLVLVLFSCAALAEDGNISGLNSDVKALLNKDGLGSAVEDYIHFSNVKIGSNVRDHEFVLTSTNGKTHVVSHYVNVNGVWKLDSRSSNLSPQGEGFVAFRRHSAGDLYGNDVSLYNDGNGFTIYRIPPEYPDMEAQAVSLHLLSGKYQIVGWHDYLKSSGTTAYVRNGRIHFYNWNNGSYLGSVNLYTTYTLKTSFSVLPKSWKAAKEKYSDPPTIPGGSLVAESIKFTSEKKYNVYSGPGEYYLRGGNGKAVVSTNDWIQVFGSENGWIMIQYGISNDHMRIGYIPESSLPKNATVHYLNNYNVHAWTNGSVNVTDDPLYSRSVLASLPDGSRVTWLGSMGSWAYIESETGTPFRGFVLMDSLTVENPAEAVQSGHQFASYTDAAGNVYDNFVITRMDITPDHRVTAVTGHYERVAMAPEGYDTGISAGTDVVYALAPDFRADMIASMTGETLDNVPVTDLYQWYVDAYMDGFGPADGILTFEYDMSPEELENSSADFWFVTTKIELNNQNQITYMEYEYVPWA